MHCQLNYLSANFVLNCVIMDVDSSATLTTSRSLESYRDLFLTSWIEEDGFTKFMPDNILTDLKYLANLVEKDFR